jgi:hypothetical protein
MIVVGSRENRSGHVRHCSISSRVDLVIARSFSQTMKEQIAWHWTIVRANSAVHPRGIAKRSGDCKNIAFGPFFMLRRNKKRPKVPPKVLAR